MNYSLRELMTIVAARHISDHQIVFVGTGLPLVATLLAKMTHAPNVHMLYESGTVDPDLQELPRTVADARVCHKAAYCRTVGEINLHYLTHGRVDLGFIGGAQLDKYGGVNSTIIGSYLEPKVRLSGSGGASDIVSLAKRVLVIMNHEKRRLVERVDYLTSPGWRAYKWPEGSFVPRQEAGMRPVGPWKVITNLGILDFDENTKEAYLAYYYPGVTKEQVRENTGFAIDVSRAQLLQIEPTDLEIKLLREKIDPTKRIL